jgi:hypothetical protein
MTEDMEALKAAITDYRDASGYLVGRYMRAMEGKPVHDLDEAYEWFASSAAKLDRLASSPEVTRQGEKP